MKENIFECSFPLEVNVAVKASVVKYVPATRHSPEEPAHIDDMELRIYGVKVPQDMLDKILEVDGKEIEQNVWDTVEIEEEDMNVARYEDYLESKEDR